MSTGTAQAVQATISVDQSVSVDNPVEVHSVTQAVTVTMGTAYIMVLVNPASSIPTGG